MNDIKGIIEDVEKTSLESDKVIKKVIEIIGQEEWNDIHDEESDICTTTGELIITLKGIPDLEKENTELKHKVCELEDKIKQYENSYDEFCAEQIQRKGYVCPGNLWNPELRDMSASELCPACEHYKNDCIVYGKKKGKW